MAKKQPKKVEMNWQHLGVVLAGFVMTVGGGQYFTHSRISDVETEQKQTVKETRVVVDSATKAGFQARRTNDSLRQIYRDSLDRVRWDSVFRILNKHIH